MAGWTVHRGRAVHLPLENVDTDQLIPARFMSIPRAQGYGDHLLYDMRRDADGGLDPGFPLNNAQGESILIAGGNFGSGSSREAAVYALVDAGFRVVVAPSFGDIFAGNAVNNGLCPARMDTSEIDSLLEVQAQTMSVDLEAQVVQAGAVSVPFELDATWARKLINGWDDIDLTRQEGDAIAGYRRARLHKAGAWPGGVA